MRGEETRAGTSSGRMHGGHGGAQGAVPALLLFPGPAGTVLSGASPSGPVPFKALELLPAVA